VSVSEVKKQIDQMTEDERFYVAAYLQHLVNEKDAGHRSASAGADRRMDAGAKVAFGDLVTRHEALEKAGR